MKKCIVVLISLVLFAFGCFSGVSAKEIIWQDRGAGTNIQTVLIHSDNPLVVYAGSDGGIMKTEDGGRNWRNIFSTRGQNKSVNLLSFDVNNKNIIYASTGAGLYRSQDNGNSWKRIFQGKGYLEKECIAFASLPYALFLGTKNGLFISNDNGRNWHRAEGKVGVSQCMAVACNLKEVDFIYIACADGIFKSKDKGRSWERIFLASSKTEEVIGQEEDVDDQIEEEEYPSIKYMAIDPDHPDCLYLATAKGIYKSRDKGSSWSTFSAYGMLSREVNFLLISDKSILYAVTKSGVFEYRDDLWKELSLRLLTQEINSLAIDIQGNLYAACSNGLFKAEREGLDDCASKNPLDEYYKNEPKIGEVQQAAIRYAEVQPEKIQLWRKQAAKKAWMPQVSLGFDRNASDLWHWESGSSTKAEDDVLRKGKDTIEWDVSLSWDLSELIWSDDQTSIDVRSRLTVQLRDEILDEVTKTYFERIRVKIELDNLAIEDRKKRIEKELRLKELTASLNALSGGYFSQRLSSP
jgi:photosystem II stability/assembly factor-like uncharacterized protein